LQSSIPAGAPTGAPVPRQNLVHLQNE